MPSRLTRRTPIQCLMASVDESSKTVQYGSRNLVGFVLVHMLEVVSELQILSLYLHLKPILQVS